MNVSVRAIMSGVCLIISTIRSMLDIRDLILMRLTISELGVRWELDGS